MAKDEITFEEVHIVKCNKKTIGEIRVVAHPKYATTGYQYFPKGQRTGGEVFLTLQPCKNSLRTP